MLGRTYASGFESDLDDWLLRRPRRAALNPAWPWAVWYPLRRTGSFARLTPQEQGTIIREHSVIGRAYGEADLVHDIRPPCHGLAGGKIYLGSADRGAKVRNIKANPLVAVTVDVYSDYWNGLKGVMVQGRAKLIERGPAFQRARRKLYDKYPQYPTDAALSPSDSVIIEITPIHVFTWGF